MGGRYFTMIEHNCHWIDGVDEPNKCRVCGRIIYTRREAEAFGWVKKVKKKQLTKQETGRLARKHGQLFEHQVRKDLEADGWTVCKWQNIIKDGKLIHAPHKYMPFKKVVIPGSGFPDFIAFRKGLSGTREIIGVESKKNKYLDQAEKDMCNWYIDNNTFDQIIVAYKSKDNEVKYYEYVRKNEQETNNQ